MPEDNLEMPREIPKISKINSQNLKRILSLAKMIDREPNKVVHRLKESQEEEPKVVKEDLREVKVANLVVEPVKLLENDSVYYVKPKSITLIINLHRKGRNQIHSQTGECAFLISEPPPG